MKIIECDIEGPLVIEPSVFGDERGFFLESWNEKTFADAGLDLTFVQDNHSRSQRGVLRGLHFQNPAPQGKLVRVVSGSVFDVAVSFSSSSPKESRRPRTRGDRFIVANNFVILLSVASKMRRLLPLVYVCSLRFRKEEPNGSFRAKAINAAESS